MTSTCAADRPAVLMVGASYLPSTGGTEPQLHGLARALTARGVHVEILTGHHGRRFQVFHAHTANLLAIVAVVIGRLSRRPPVRYPAPRAGAPITSVAAPLGHITPTTTLRYAQWLPTSRLTYVDALDAVPAASRGIRGVTHVGCRFGSPPARACQRDMAPIGRHFEKRRRFLGWDCSKGLAPRAGLSQRHPD
jgi:hypothetical protein